MSLSSKNVSISKDIVYPELRVITNSGNLPAGTSQLFQLQKIDPKNQIVDILEIGADAVDNVFIQPSVDGELGEQIHSLNLGIDEWVSVFGGHPLDYAAKQWNLNYANNTAGTSNNYRSAVHYIVDALDTMRRMANNIPLTPRDNEAMDDLAKHPELTLDPRLRFKLGIGVPQNFQNFLELHVQTKTKRFGTTRATNLSSTAYDLINYNNPTPGDKVLILERLYLQRPTQSEQGQVSVSVYVDGKDTPEFTIDPSCLEEPQNSSSTGIASLSAIDLHVHAFKNMLVQISASSGTYNNYAALGLVTESKMQVAFKAKIAEFIGINNLPDGLEISKSELDIMDTFKLREMARVGLLPA